MSALTRSNSLSLNTGGGAGLFGSTPATQGGGLFGASNTTQSQTAGSLFSSTLKPPASSAPSTQGLFGTPSSAQPQSTPSPFGNTSSQAQATPSLFGTPGTSQPQQSSNMSSGGFSLGNPGQSLFGKPPASSGTGTSSLFPPAGGSNTTLGGGLFSTQGSSQPQQSSGTTAGSMFGSAGAQSKPSGFGLFPTPASQPTQQPQFTTVAGPTFGGKPITNLATSGGGITGGMRFGGGTSTAPQPQVVQGVQVDISNIRGTTRFSELHPNVQQDIIKIDNLTAAQIKICETCDAVVPAHRETLDFIPNDAEYVSTKVDAVEAALANDAEAIAALKKIVRQDQEEASNLRGCIDMLKLPTNLQMSGLWHQYLGGQPALGIKAGNAVADAVGGGYDEGPPDLVKFFKGRSDEVEKELNVMQGLIGEIEAHLRLVEGRAANEAENLARRGRVQEMDSQAVVRELVQTMQGFEDAVLRVAGRVGGVREKFNEVTMAGQNGLGPNGPRR
ncbi:hypothetical protein P152DRAFT_483882 [Eremomyces bilateralis CBS 781.70]|uniref:Nucleoporin NUP49/NSP49 n=1 Tax=Eremomyces bilateralis CBS 781.70 TaxID=1392243 RepID=A0A6G1FXU8_9PEZI|nr:uncharacterized protein P152DRAFT_483882 [Eremomyces bilateralis CBS 781.70]KAF1810419.1 hypothetical protein P152DRAFT_483882 [Eremomyces bilateralis CBS 781.70]